MAYNKDNVFYDIINQQLKVKKIYEDHAMIAIYDINPVAPIHVLVIPKGQYLDYSDFVFNASSDEIKHYFTKIADIAKSLDLNEYRLITNKGERSGQSIFHFHTHIIGGKQITALIDKDDVND